MSQNDLNKIREGIRDIKRKRRFVWIVFLTYLPVVVAIGSITNSEKAAIYTAIAWMVLYGVSGIRVAVTRCPRCGEHYHLYRRKIILWSNPWTRRCLNCGLKLIDPDGLTTG